MSKPHARAVRKARKRDGPVRGHIREAGVLRVAHGLFRPCPDEADPDVDVEFRRDLEAWLLVLPEGARFTHVTAARLRRWQLPQLPEQVPVFASVGSKDLRPRRPGLVCSRLVRTSAPTMVQGLPTEPAEEVLLRAARDLGLIDLTIMVDSARRLGDVDDASMEVLLDSRRPGVRMLREAWRVSTPKAESAGETVLRLFDLCMEVAVEPQVELRDDAGNTVAVADLLVVGTQLLHEYDGAHHRMTAQQRVDLRRGRGLAQTAYDRRGFTLDDLLNHPGVLMHELDRDLGRSHRLARLYRWRRWLRSSLYSEEGRRRVMNRWQREMGLVDWSGTA